MSDVLLDEERCSKSNMPLSMCVCTYCSLSDRDKEMMYFHEVAGTTWETPLVKEKPLPEDVPLYDDVEFSLWGDFSHLTRIEFMRMCFKTISDCYEINKRFLLADKTANGKTRESRSFPEFTHVYNYYVDWVTKCNEKLRSEYPHLSIPNASLDVFFEHNPNNKTS